MKKPVVFICHSNKNKEFVRNLVKRLNTDGIDTWLDEVEISVGEFIHQKVNEGLKKSDLFIIVLSRASVESRWVQEELSSASNIEKYSNRGIFILPLLLEECDVPPLLLDRRYANFKDDPESAYQELLDSIYQHFHKAHPEVNVSEIPVAELNETLIEVLAENPQKLADLPPRHFEQLVARLLAKKGYEVQLTPITQDGGYNIIARSRPDASSPPEETFVQCKKYRRPVGVSDITQLIGVLVLLGGERGALFTSSYFTKAAKQLALNQRIDLVDGQMLSKWLRAS
jgi:hypothetical protein